MKEINLKEGDSININTESTCDNCNEEVPYRFVCSSIITGEKYAICKNCYIRQNPIYYILTKIDNFLGGS